MKRNVLLLVCVFALYSITNAQVKTPAASPSCKIEQAIGLTSVTLEYSRPSQKDRTIFGDLVPYDKKWRTGANKNTMITFTDKVNFGGTDVEPGTYALFTQPSASSWEWWLYTDTENWGTPEEWSDDNVAATGKVNVSSISNGSESFNLYFDDLRDASATLNLDWADKRASWPVTLSTEEAVMKTIETTMAGPSGNDYYRAARYYRENGKDLKTSLEWMDKSIELRGEKFWILRQKSLVQADMGDYKGAITTAQRSIELAKEAGNDGYVKSNEASIKEWGMKK